MSTIGSLLPAAYVAGVVWGLLKIDDRPGVRIGLAVLWPLGPMAFVVTLATLLVAAAIAFPLLGLAVVALAVLSAVLMF